MITLQKFTGINNTIDPKEMGQGDLSVGSNIDVDLAQRISRRSGFAQDVAGKHANLWEAGDYTLATRGAGGDLVNTDTGTVLAAGLGHTPRVWYTPLPGGRTAYSNGTAKGIVAANGESVLTWGVPVPAGVGAAADGIGNLYPGNYQWAVTHVRLADGAESGPVYSAGAVTVSNGAVVLSGLPVLAGHKLNVYLTSQNGGERYYAGSTTNALFSFTGYNKDLVRRCPTEFLQPPPAGAKLIAFWRGRMLAAVGNALFASRSHAWHLFDMRRDFKQFSADITLVHPTDGGVWVGTERELAFLAGDNWDKLARVVKVTGGVVLGSGASVPGEHLRVGNGVGKGNCMVCIADGWLVAGTAEGDILPLSVDRYRAVANEVSAAFRLVDGIPQYIAAVQ